MSQGKSNDPRETLLWKQQVLLVDASKRRDVRAASLRHAGMVVHCASNGASAAALWEPEKYQLVLFEFSEAETDMRPFCEKLMRTLPRQKIGMYSPVAPFILPPRWDSRTSATAGSTVDPAAVGDPLQDALAAAAENAALEPEIAPDRSASSSRPIAQQPIANLRKRTLVAAARKNGHYGLAEAAQEIAALRWRQPSDGRPVRQSMETPNPQRQAARRMESHASIAARVLGGEQ